MTNGTGDCFSVAFKIIQRNAYKLTEDRENLRLAHAVVEAKTVGKHWHAFVINKSTNEVIDKSNGHDVTLPAALYFAMGNISTFTEYTWDQVIQHALDTKHYGPWD